jgi:hypothetical protein
MSTPPKTGQAATTVAATVAALKAPVIRSCPEARPIDAKDRLVGVDAEEQPNTPSSSSSSATGGGLFPTLVLVPANALDELAVALASFSGTRGALPFLNVYDSLAANFMMRTGTSIFAAPATAAAAADDSSLSSPSPAAHPTVFGSPEDLEAKRHYAAVLAFLFNQQIRANELTVRARTRARAHTWIFLSFSKRGEISHPMYARRARKKNQLHSHAPRARRRRSRSASTSRGS